MTLPPPTPAAPRWLPCLRVAVFATDPGPGAKIAKGLEQRLASGLGPEGEGPLGPAGREALTEAFELRVFSTAPPAPPDVWLDQTLHTVLVVLLDQAVFDDTALAGWLHAAARHLEREPGRHSLFAVPWSDELLQRWQSERETLGLYQALPWYLLGEPAERQDILSLRVLNHMVRALAAAVFNPEWKLRVFISHAKQDGLYLAQSVRHFIQGQGWLEDFYDAADIEPGRRWENELRSGVGRSLLLVLRTDAYDRRLWCRQEVRWADVLGVPVVVVDARSGLVYPASNLPFDGAETVRVPDGNLPRILFSVLETTLRSMLFQRAVRQLRELGLVPADRAGLQVMGVTPGIAAIVRACEDLSSAPAGPRLLVYPDPPLPEGLLKAAQALAATVDARVLTPRQLRESPAR